MEKEERLKDGVYIIYADGSHELFNGENRTEGAKYVGVVMGEKSVAIGLTDIKDDDKNEWFAVFADAEHIPWEYGYPIQDFNGAENTEFIKEHGSPIPFDKFKDGEYIASLGEWCIVMMHMNKVNDALAYVDGDKIISTYWSSTGCAMINDFDNYQDSCRVTYHHPCHLYPTTGEVRRYSTNGESHAIRAFAKFM